ncbi:F-box domain-containing protein [Mycena indigotica]|uniref:F-box domain-containing protein n=1 Tax=Mycena indigotica TaxID=2126181 RepID=A0A8H6W430_9AGAR|nr:F-box domain-containing protein [Mycena indigotica]KAF7302146.1 F-box domain-containing protein [Mycena indigotica]
MITELVCVTVRHGGRHYQLAFVCADSIVSFALASVSPIINRMTRAVLRERMPIEDHVSPKIQSFADLNDDVLSLIFELLNHTERLKIAGLSRHLRNVLLPRIFRGIRWAPGVQDFPLRKLWPVVQVFMLSGAGIEELTREIRQSIADRLFDAFPSMNLLHTFIFTNHKTGGMWPELVESFSTLPKPCDLIIDSSWAPGTAEDPITLAPATPSLRLSGLSYPFPLLPDDDGWTMRRRTPRLFDYELPNLRAVLTAGSETLLGVDIPGEFLSAMFATRWNSLTYLHLYGFWPLFQDSTTLAIETELSSKPATSTQLPEAVSILEPPAPGSDDLAVSISATVKVQENSSSSIGETSPTQPTDTVVTTLSDSDVGLSAPLESVTEIASHSDAGTSLPAMAAKSSFEDLSPDTSPIAPRRRLPILSVLKSMPNLRVLIMKLLHQVNDEQPVGAIICDQEASSSYDPLLPHLLEFTATSLSNDDRTVALLPSTLEVLSLQKYPRTMERGTLRAMPTPSGLLEMLRSASFPGLDTLHLWYLIESSEELDAEKTLLDSIPTMFPLLQDLELCRRWDHSAESLKGLWDPSPRFQKLASELKHLKFVMLDAAPPERYHRPPVQRSTREFREVMVNLYGIALAVVRAAPWIQNIGMYRAYGVDPDMFWEYWDVVVSEGTAGLDRPPPLITDSPHYPDPI